MSDETTCDHGITFDEAEAEKLLEAAPAPKDEVDFIMGPVDAVSEIRKRWPRGWFTAEKPCPKGCSFRGIAYASWAHYTMGDW